MREQRRFTRIPEHSPVSYRILSDTEAREVSARDISQEGISFYAHEPVSKNTLLIIKLTSEKTLLSFECFVRVKWVKEDKNSSKYNIGAEFINMPKEVTSRLIKYIKNTQKKP